MAERKRITFETQMPPSSIISGDKNMLSTVVRNLLANAVKFTAKGGTVTLNISPRICTDAACHVSTVVVSITDTGIGMSPEQQQNLFRLDVQQSRKGTAGEQGSGLGLIVCREFLEKNNATLYVESEEGRGSRFWFACTSYPKGINAKHK